MNNSVPSDETNQSPAKTPPAVAIAIAALLALGAVAAAAWMLMGGGSKKPSGAPIAVKTPSAVTASSRPMVVTEFTPARNLDFRLVEKKTKAPVAGVQIKIRYQGQNGPEIYEQTDADGRIKIPLPAEDPKEFSLSVKPSGYVPLKLYWGGNQNKLPIPSEYTLETEKGSTIGGVVKDEEGNPIEGAQISLGISSDRNSPLRVEFGSTDRPRTDAEGKWRFNKAPSNPERIYVSVRHPNYLPKPRGSVTMAPEQLLKQTALSTMQKGIELTGTVVDAEGQPVIGANVLVGDERYSSDALKARTDGAGKFRIPNAVEGATVVTVSARNNAPDLKLVTVKKQMEPLEFKLAKGSRIRGKVVDSSGNPVPGAQVSLGQWRGRDTLEFTQQTRDDGTFEWNGAPAETLSFYVYKEKYRTANNLNLAPGDKEHLVTLQEALVVSGSVVDAESGQPLPSFRVIKGRAHDERNQPYFERYNMKTFTKGQYEMDYTDEVRMVVIRIEADGYKPQVSPRTRPTGNSLTLDFKMVKGTGPSGTVLMADGKPAAGAQLGLASTGQNINVSDGDLSRYSDNVVVRAGADGKFVLNPEAEPFRIVAVHESGYAEVSQEEFKVSPEIKLTPWSRVEGQFMLGTKPAAGARISMYHQRSYEEGKPQIYHNYNAMADEQGRFKVEKVVPGKISIGRMIEHNEGNSRYWTTTNVETFEVKPGETLSVTVGGKGREVIGQMEIPKDLPEGKWRIDNSQISTFVRSSPKNEVKSAIRSLLSRGAGATTSAQNVEYRNYSFRVEPDGKFKVEDVLPGTYQLRTYIYEIAGNNRYANMLASVNHEFTVPENPPGEKERPALDLGTIKMIRHVFLKAGDAAPAFDLKTVDGKSAKLEDYKGKHLLVVFWSASWDDPQQLDAINAVHKEFGSHDGFAVLGLAHYGSDEQLKERMKTLAITWPQVSVPPQPQEGSLMNQFTSQRFPGVFLIGPDGKIVARDMYGEEIRAAVAKALGKN
jgi:protocatechuate 3,4-dioxygenase beta subunit/peroxiredoxin